MIVRFSMFLIAVKTSFYKVSLLNNVDVILTLKPQNTFIYIRSVNGQKMGPLRVPVAPDDFKIRKCISQIFS